MADEFILIKDGIAYAFEGRIVGKAPVSDLLSTVHDRGAVRPRFLPYFEKGCAAFGQNDERRFYLMYLEPRPRIIKFMNEANHKTTLYRLILPHSYVCIFFRRGAIEAGHAFVARKKIWKMSDPIGAMPFPNIDANGLICMGTAAKFNASHDPATNTANYLDLFLESNFTSHIMNNANILPKELSPGWGYQDEPYRWQEESFAKWQKFSEEKGKDAILELPWRTETTLGELVRRNWALKEGDI